MTLWPSRRLAEVATVIRGVTFDKGDAVTSARPGYAAILRAGNIDEHLDISEDLIWVPESCVSAEQYLLPGDIVICMSSGSASVLGKSAQLDSPWHGSVGAFCAILRFHDVHPRFAAYWLRSPAFEHWRDRQANGANIQNLRKSALEALDVPYPPADEQARVVEVLDEVESLRRLRVQSQQRVRTLQSALFAKMFGAATWPTKTLGDLCEVKGGKRLPKGEEYSADSTPFRYIRVTDVDEGVIHERGLKYLKPETQRAIARYTVATGDLVITIAGSIGVVATVPPALEGVNLTENAAKLTAREIGTYDVEFLAHYLMTPEAKQQIGARTGQVTIGKLALFRIEQIEVPLPPIDLQREFASRIRAVRSLADCQAESRHQLTLLRESLVHRAFSGGL